MTQTQTVDPKALLLAEVSVPAFFEKLAAETGFSPPDAATGDTLLGTGNLIANTVDLYLQKAAAAQTGQSASVVKMATDAAFQTAGIFAPLNKQAAPAQYLETSGVRDAALLLIAEAQKQASQQPEPEAPAATPEGDDAKKN